MCVCVCVCVCVKALRGAGFGPQPAGPRGLDFWICCGAVWAGFFIWCGAVRAAGQTSVVRPGLRARICQKYAGQAAGRMIQLRGGLSFFSQNLHIVCAYKLVDYLI